MVIGGKKGKREGTSQRAMSIREYGSDEVCRVSS